MKNALSLVCMLLAGILMPTTSFAQSNTLFNPDYNGDGFIGVDDILGALSFYDTAWDGPVSPYQPIHHQKDRPVGTPK